MYTFYIALYNTNQASAKHSTIFHFILQIIFQETNLQER